MMLLQNFAFPPDVIKYIMATNDSDIVMKLYKTCKYFHYKINLLLVHGIRHSFKDILEYDEKAIAVNPQTVNRFKNLWITYQFISITNDTRLSTWISKISRCTISYLNINANNLMFNEFKILTESGSVEDMEINNVFYENRSKVPVEVLLSYVPKATSIICRYAHVTPTSMKIISELMTRKSKMITVFNLRNIDGMLDDEEFYQFMRKYAAQDAAFYVEFASNISKEDAKKFGSSVKFKNFMSKDPNPKPYFSYSL